MNDNWQHSRYRYVHIPSTFGMLRVHVQMQIMRCCERTFTSSTLFLIITLFVRYHLSIQLFHFDVSTEVYK